MQFPDIGGTIDSAFNSYLQQAALKRQQDESSTMQNLQLMQTFGPGVTMEGLQANPNALTQGFQAAQNQGPLPGAEQGADPLVTALANWQRKRAASDALGVRKESAGIADTEADALKKRAEALSLLNPNGKPMTPTERANVEGKLYDDYRNAAPVKNFANVRDAYRSIAALGKTNSGIADIGIVYSLVKLMDPNSAVREGELALSNQATPLAQRIATAWNNAKSGRVSASEKNKVILDAARSFYDQAKKGADTERSNVQSRAKQYPGLNPDLIAPDLGIPDDELASFSAPQPPVPGAMLKTHKTLGRGWFVPEGNGFKLVQKVP